MRSEPGGFAEVGGGAPATAGVWPAFTHRQIVAILFGLVLGMLVAVIVSAPTGLSPGRR